MKRKQNKPNEIIQTTFLISSVSTLLKIPNVDSITVQNSYGAISVTKYQAGKGTAHAIGFSVDPEETDQEEYDEEEFNRAIVDIMKRATK